MYLHPYDGIERRFSHTDANHVAGLALVARLLGLAQPLPPGVRYGLSFYSGGMGIFDNLAITIPTRLDIWARVAAALNAVTLDEASRDPDWAEDFLWLVSGEDRATPLREAAVRFINENRLAFQTACQPDQRILFAVESNVNSWTALWGDDTTLNYRCQDQG